MATHVELATLVRQRTWDKELLLWFGAEAKLLPLLATVHVEVLDLLDLFQPDSISVDDDEVRRQLSLSLRQSLRSIPRVAARRSALVVLSKWLAGTLSRG